ncbi:aquaporin [Streptomyces sp. CA-106131]|uniref:aquaporin n=1 Tax=Streptomyces sp. CA-106131 TaxID=3240045 RepID=UPI003D89BFA9
MGTQSRRSLGRHNWREWLSKFAATAILLLVMVTLFRYLFGAGSVPARALPSPEGQLVADAVVSGTTVGLLIISPFGRRSGGHMNPAVSLVFWLMGALPGRDAAAYAASQLAGPVAGVGPTDCCGAGWRRIPPSASPSADPLTAATDAVARDVPFTVSRRCIRAGSALRPARRLFGDCLGACDEYRHVVGDWSFVGQHGAQR